MMTDQPEGQLHLENIDPLKDREFMVRKRDGRTEPFNEARILIALESAFKAEAGVKRDENLDAQWQDLVKALAESVARSVLARAVRGEELEVERIQDAVEDRLMVGGFHAVARRYILYREERRKARLHKEQLPDGSRDRRELMEDSASDATSHESEGDFQTLLDGIYAEALPRNPTIQDRWSLQREHFQTYIEYGVSVGRLSPDLLKLDLESLGNTLAPERDTLLSAAALRHLRDHYFLTIEGRVVESPQYFWMRVAMGFALAEPQNQTARAREFYHAVSLLRFLPSLPALFHAGRLKPQWIGEYAVTVRNDLEDIFKTIGDGARLAQQGVNVFINWSAVGAKGGRIAGLNGAAPGLLHFLRTAEAAIKAVESGSLNPRALTVSLGLWHLEVQDFLKFVSRSFSPNDHGLRTSVLVPDVFMRRVEEDATWTLFNPPDVPELANSFERNYIDCERRAELGEFGLFKKVCARDIWRQLMQTVQHAGAPSIVFMEASFAEIGEMNSQPHASASPSGCINLAAHAGTDGIDELLLSQTVSSAMRILDNCVEMESFVGQQGAGPSFPDREVAMGMIGCAEVRAKIDLAAEADALEWMDHLAEKFAYYTILASAGLAQERGPFPGFKISAWAQGLLPADRVALLQKGRRDSFPADAQASLEWSVVRREVKRHGVRNGKMLAASPAPGNETFSKLIGSLPECEAGDPGRLLEIGRRCQKWLEMNFPVYLGGLKSEETLSETLMVAWKKGLKELHCYHRKKGFSQRISNLQAAIPADKPALLTV